MLVKVSSGRIGQLQRGVAPSETPIDHFRRSGVHFRLLLRMPRITYCKTRKELPLMYVCICNAIREKDLRTAARRCDRADATTLYGSLGFAPQCGQCLEDAAEIIEDERACQLA